MKSLMCILSHILDAFVKLHSGSFFTNKSLELVTFRSWFSNRTLCFNFFSQTSHGKTNISSILGSRTMLMASSFMVYNLGIARRKTLEDIVSSKELAPLDFSLSFHSIMVLIWCSAPVWCMKCVFCFNSFSQTSHVCALSKCFLKLFMVFNYFLQLSHMKSLTCILSSIMDAFVKLHFEVVSQSKAWN